MEEDQDISFETVTEESEGEESVEDIAQTAKEKDALTLDEINKRTGRNYKSVDAFLDSFENTRKFVGEKREKVAKEIFDSGNFISKTQYETDMFFSKNQSYERDRPIIEALAKANGISVQEAVNTETYKSTALKFDGYEKSKEVENVLKSNPRIAEVKDTMDKAQTARSSGDIKTAERLAVQGVIESLGM